ncbi:MAG: methionyl-tRNA synthetase [Pseudomonadota bacterium]|jgi:methionyl-tRNA synthetase
MQKNKNFYITTPIYYVNDKPHIGHFYCNLLTDTFIRFNKLFRHKTTILTGTDEHGQKIQRSAEKKNINPQEFCDEYSNYFKQMSVDFDFLFAKNNFNNGQNFIRTTDEKHKNFVQKTWLKLQQNGWIYKGSYSGWYAIRDEAFYDDNEIFEDNGVKKAIATKAEVEWREEESYFFKMSAFNQLLLDLYEEEKNLIIPNEKANEITAILAGKNGGQLQDLSISRMKKTDSTGSEFHWGIAVPNDEKHVIYVWLDALFNYYSANEQIWQTKQGKITHFIGKEILKFHAIYWPAFLIALNYDENNLKNAKTENIKPLIFDNIYTHGWWTNEGEKISKSLGNIVDPYKEIEWLESEFSLDKNTAIDYLKYFCISSVPFGSDADYSRLALTNVVNSQIANNIGNLCQRVTSFLNKNFRTEIDKINHENIANFINPEHQNFLTSIKQIDSKHADEVVENNLLSNADFFTIIKLVNEKFFDCNKFLETNEPWRKTKNNQKDEALSCLLAVLEVFVFYGKLLLPVIPHIAQKLLQNCGSDVQKANFTCNPSQIPEDLQICCPRLVIR